MKIKSDSALMLFFFKTPVLVILILTGILLNTNSLHSEENSAKTNIFNPEESATIYAYGGYGYYRWKMMSMESITDALTSDIPTSGMRFKHESTPYVVKKYGVKTNISFLSFGLDYFGDTLSLPAMESDKEKKLEEDESKKARQLKYLSGIGFGDLSFHFNITRRDFDSTITSKGYKPLMNPTVPIYYYPETGDPVTLAEGDKAAWYTSYTDYEGKLVRSSGPYAFEFGARYVRYDAPTELSISQNGSRGDVLMFTENRMVTLFMGIGTFSRIAGDFYLHYYVPVNIAGYYYAENSYFDVEDKKPFSKNTLSLTTSSSGNLSLAYIIKHFKLEGGMDYGFYYSQLMLTDAKLKKDVDYTNSVSGITETASAGSKVNIEAKRIEFLWGFYLHASAYF
jgi:hypothetical protein